MIIFIPTDLLLLTSSYEDGICCMDTMNLDGETNLKMNFLKCSIVGTAYGVCSSEVELTATKHMAFDIGDQDVRFYKRVF